MKTVKLFCIPYAGGLASAYYKWNNLLNDNIILYPIELSGHGRRISNPLYNCLDDAVEDITKFIVTHLSDGDYYMIFGHSMGSILTFEVIHKLIKQNKDGGLIHAFFSGRKPPQISGGKKIHHVDKETFIKEVLLLGGTPEEVFRDQVLCDLVMPILRADFKMLENYEYKEHEKRLFINSSILYGNNDINTPKVDMQAWSCQFSKDCDFYEFQGGHFFINESQSDIISLINTIVLKYI